VGRRQGRNGLAPAREERELWEWRGLWIGYARTGARQAEGRGELALCEMRAIIAMYHIRDTLAALENQTHMDMGKTGYITARIEPKLKARAARVLANVGVSTTDAITMFLRQVVLRNGLPFEVRAPNAETRKAIAELESGGGERFEATTSALVDHVRGRRRRKRRV
jgi:DNA-damage-inducible protein J